MASWKSGVLFLYFGILSGANARHVSFVTPASPPPCVRLALTSECFHSPEKQTKTITPVPRAGVTCELYTRPHSLVNFHLSQPNTHQSATYNLMSIDIEGDSCIQE